ncbi:MAG: ABC-type transporter, integral rane subunit [Actinomycetia bacterium]|nr:ABC-type transporter, integral rane subunit [Actinomycetes bacterium]
MAVEAGALSAALAGLDALEEALLHEPSWPRRTWSLLWPKLAAIILAIFLWQCVVWWHWKPEYVLPAPGTVFRYLWDQADTGRFWSAIGRTLKRGLTGYLVAVVLGTLIGMAVARVKILRVAIGSMITGLQTMPSVAWLPLAVVLFQLGEGAILFVVILGATPSIANGVISGIDHVPPLLLRSGRMLGAKGLATYRHVVMPAALPTFVGGLKQGWSFAWRSLMAGELIAFFPGKFSIGQEMENAKNVNDMAGLVGWMVVILILGIVIDSLFTKADLSLRRRWGLIDNAST